MRPVNISHLNGKLFSFVVGVWWAKISFEPVFDGVVLISCERVLDALSGIAPSVCVTIESVCYSLLGSQSKLHTLLFFHVFISALEFSLK